MYVFVDDFFYIILILGQLCVAVVANYLLYSVGCASHFEAH